MTNPLPTPTPETPELFTYQQIGAQWLASRKYGLLGDEPGLGKSAQAITACKLLGLRKVLVICPASLAENWTREFRKFGWHKPEVYSYEKAAANYISLSLENWDVVIADEAHYLKTAGAKRTKMFYGEEINNSGIARHAEHVWLLSGTPMPNNPSELWPHLYALAPETILHKDGVKPMAYWPFVTKFCQVRDNKFGMQIKGGKNLGELADRLKPFMLRRLKKDVLPDLPEIRYDHLYLKGQLVVNAKECDEVRAALERDGIEGLASVVAHVATLRRLTGIAKIQPTTEWLKTWEKGGGEKIVVFAYHREVLDALYAEFKDMAVMVRGDTPSSNRQAAVDKFQNVKDCKIFFGQINAAGVGLTLTAASEMLLVEQSWVPAENQQAVMRIHRISQTRGCLVRVVTLSHTIDEDIARAVVRKLKDIKEVVG